MFNKRLAHGAISRKGGPSSLPQIAIAPSALSAIALRAERPEVFVVVRSALGPRRDVVDVEAHVVGFWRSGV